VESRKIEIVILRLWPRVIKYWLYGLHICAVDEDVQLWFTVPGPKPKVDEGTFDDLMGGLGGQFTSRKGPMTIKEMRKDVDVKDLDPDTRRVRIGDRNL